MRKNKYAFTYLPLCHLDEVKERLEDLFDLNYVFDIWKEYNPGLAEYNKINQCDRLNLEKDFEKMKKMHKNFMRGLDMRPQVKGVWISVLYPIQEKDRNCTCEQKRVKVACLTSSNVSETIANVMPENNSCVITKTVYYAMLAIFINNIFEMLEMGKAEINSKTKFNPYMDYMTGFMKHLEESIKSGSNYRPLINGLEITRDDEGDIIRVVDPQMGKYFPFLETRFEDLTYYKELTANFLPVTGYFGIFVQDDMNGERPIKIIRRPTNLKVVNSKIYGHPALNPFEEKEPEPEGRALAFELAKERRTTIIMLCEQTNRI